MAINDILMAASGAGPDKTFIEDVFSTFIYTGNGSTQTINNGIDLAGKGGMVWIKNRSSASSNRLWDSSRSVTGWLQSDTTDAVVTNSNGVTSFGSSGFSVGSYAGTNLSAEKFASWTFRKAPKFFDVVTYTGTGTTRSISHSLGQEPGMIIVKCTSYNSDWIVYHRSTGATSWLALNQTWSSDNTTNYWNNTAPTSSVFTVRANELGVNASGQTYVAYLFAHDTTTDGLIQCGSYTGNGSADGPEINLGWEPQLVLIKGASSDVSGTYWQIVDNMRGFSNSTDAILYPNTSGTEYYGNTINPTATGFKLVATGGYWNNNGSQYIYMAIRRGPMRTPTDGTKVFSSLAVNNGLGSINTIGFPIDTQIARQRNSAYDTWVVDRLRYAPTGTTTQTDIPTLTTTSTSSESQASTTGYWDNTSFQTQTLGNVSAIYWNFRRAPGFFDVVCYTGTGVVRTVNHNLGVAPELMIVKRRNTADDWAVYSLPTGNNNCLFLNSTSVADSSISYWNNTTPTATGFSVWNNTRNNASGSTYVAYLFASCPGVSKVGSYTGNGTNQTINCSFTNGARFVLIKRTDSTGAWYVWDTARGIVTANDPHLSLNSTAAEVTTDDTIDPESTGFIVNQVAATNVNVNAATYIYLAIA